MHRIILLAVFVILSGCASYKNLEARSLVGVWEAREEENYLATYEFRKDMSGSYRYLNHENKCTMSYEFSWTAKSGRIFIVGYHGIEINGEYTEVILHDEIKPKYENGRLTKLKPKNANRHFSKKA